MEIIIVFEKFQLCDLKLNRNTLSKEIEQAVKKTGLLDKDQIVKLEFLEGKSILYSNKTKVSVMIGSNHMMPNMGRYILDFKNSLIDIFSSAGIALDKDSLVVKMNKTLDKNILIKNTNEKFGENQSGNVEEYDYELRSKAYIPVEPSYSFDRVILPCDVLEKIQEALGVLECENKVFDQWGLYEIQPHPSTALSFYGPSGTGKTMAAEAIASKLGKKILKVSYADVESKYHGEGPKMVKAIFLSARKNDAVLFFDEADSLLSKRLTNVSQGSEQAINSMRSQLLICLEEFRGIVIFATNLVVNYDQAFLTRLISVEFKKPDVETRKKIWDVHIRPLDDGKSHKLNIPLANDVNTMELADEYDFAGREIRNAVVDACVRVALDNRNEVSQADFIKSCDKISKEKIALAKAQNHTKNTDIIKTAIKAKLNEEVQTKDVSK